MGAEQVAKGRLFTTAMVLVSLISTATILIYTRSIMVPFVLAVFVAFIVTPGITFLKQRCKFPHGLAVVLNVLMVIVAVFLVSLLIASSVKEAASNVDTYKQSIVKVSEAVLTLSGRFGISESSLDQSSLIQALKDLPLFSYAKTVAGQMFAILSDTLLVLLFVVFLLAGQSFQLPSGGLIRSIEVSVRRYLVTKVVTSGATGILTAIILAAIGLDMAFMFGFLAFVLNFIPTVGSLLATLLPIPIALIQFQFGWQCGVAIALPGLVQFGIGNVLEPKFMGDSLDLHPVTLMLSLMFWGLLWGVPGMILATPIAVIIKLSLLRIPEGVFAAELMAGRVKL